MFCDQPTAKQAQLNALIDNIRSRLEYDPETGVIVWRISPRFGVNAGDIAGILTQQGYRYIRILRKCHAAHRLAWAIYYGEWPSFPIDHINGLRDDNRIANLRAADHQLNNQNRANPSKNNRTGGYLGVCSSTKGRKPFRAQIKVDGKKIHLGTFMTAEAAHDAYLKAKALMHRGFVAVRFANANAKTKCPAKTSPILPGDEGHFAPGPCGLGAIFLV